MAMKQKRSEKKEMKEVKNEKQRGEKK